MYVYYLFRRPSSSSAQYKAIIFICAFPRLGVVRCACTFQIILTSIMMKHRHRKDAKSVKVKKSSTGTKFKIRCSRVRGIAGLYSKYLESSQCVDLGIVYLRVLTVLMPCSTT